MENYYFNAEFEIGGKTYEFNKCGQVAIGACDVCGTINKERQEIWLDLLGDKFLCFSCFIINSASGSRTPGIYFGFKGSS